MGARDLLGGAVSLFLMFAKIALCLILAAGDRLLEQFGAGAHASVGRVDDQARMPALERS